MAMTMSGKRADNSFQPLQVMSSTGNLAVYDVDEISMAHPIVHANVKPTCE